MGAFENKIADRGGSPFLIVTIESIGDANGLTKLSDRTPSRHAPDTHRSVLRARPTLEPEQASALGGVAEQSELTVEIVDVDDFMTSLARTQARPLTYLSTSFGPTATTVTLSSGAGVTPGSTLLFIGREALLVTGLVGGTTYHVSRAQLDTEQGLVTHAAGRPVFAYTPSLYGRRVRLFLSFDAEDFSAADETELGGGWWADKIELVDLGAWRLRARSRLRHLDRLLARVAFRGVITAADWLANVLHLQTFDPRPRATAIDAHFGDRVFLELGGREIVRVDPDETDATLVRVDRRGMVGTRADEWEVGDEVRQVFVADPADDYGSIRYQAPGGETSSRSSGTWIATDHPVPIILALLTSWSGTAQTTPTNYSSGTGNFSGLPPGVGLGVPIGQIDVDSFLDVWHRTAGFRLPFLTIREPVTGREFIDEQICRVTGYDLKVSASKLALGYFRAPLAGETAVTWDDSVLAVEEDEVGNRRPLLSVRFDTELTAGAVIFRARTANGAETESVFSDVNYPEFFGDADGFYEIDDQRIEIDAPAVRVDLSGAEPEILRHRAIQLLYRHRRPLLRIEVETDLSQEGVEPGDLVSLTNSQIPDLATGVRGVTGLVCRVLTKGALTISEEKVSRAWTLIAYGASGRFGRVAPSARIASVAANTATVTANRYTDPQARGGLPSSDGLSFAVGDRVRLLDRAGAPIATVPAYQAVTGRTATTVTLDGNFGGSASFASGKVLAYVDRDSTTTTQAERFVHLADTTNRNPGTATEDAWTYGEP